MTPAPRGRRVHPILAHLVPLAEPTQQAILDDLRRVLVSGAAPPGSALPLDDLAAVFGVSLIPVRESLKTLTGEGLVEHRPRGGYTVARLTRAEFGELYLVRGALEGVALTSATARATADDHERARVVHLAEGQALRDGRPGDYHRGTRAFHQALVAPSAMHRLLHLVEATWNITEPAQSMTLLPAAVLHQMHDDHALMLEAWCVGEAPRLLALADRHTERLRAALETLPADHRAFAEPRPS